MSNQSLSESGKCLLLISLLAKQKTISNNAKSFLKEMVLRRDTKLSKMLSEFEKKSEPDIQFLEKLHDMIRVESEAVYNDLFTDTSLEVGKSLSKSEREEKKLNEDKSLIYGEVEYKSFYAILRKVQPIAGPTFYDLGSGTGKAVFAARFTGDYTRCIGIEILQGLHSQAFKITERYNENFRNLLDASQRQHAAVYMGSFLEFDWTDGDVVFANSTCFDDSLMAQMSRMAEGLKPGSVLVTFTKGLTYMDKFELLQKKREKMSWGPATVFIHRRLNHDGTPFDEVEYRDPPSDDDSMESDTDEYSSSESHEEDESSSRSSSSDGSSSSNSSSDSSSSSSSSSSSDGKKYGSFPHGWNKYYGNTSNLSGVPATDSDTSGELEQYKPQARPGKLSIQPATETDVRFGSTSPLENPGFNSPQDSALLMRKALASKRSF
eukprot:GSChrysophyteH1.ASY1.ANO1.3340.1 assembled CDS